MLTEDKDARQRALSVVNATEEQQHIIDIFLLEKWEELKHWQRNPDDDNIYIEYLNGCRFLQNLLDDEINKINKQERAKQRSANVKGKR